MNRGFGAYNKVRITQSRYLSGALRLDSEEARSLQLHIFVERCV